MDFVISAIRKLSVLVVVTLAPLFALGQESPFWWVDKTQSVLEGEIYFSGKTARELALGKELGKKLSLVMIGEVPTPSQLSEILKNFPGNKRTDFLYSYEAKSLLRVDGQMKGRSVKVKYQGIEFSLQFVETLEQARNLETFNVQRILIPVKQKSSKLPWTQTVDPNQGLRQWVWGEVRTENWNRALADPISWGLQWATLIVEQGRGGKMNLNLPGPSMDYVLERFANEGKELSPEQKQSFYKVASHPRAHQIFNVLQEVDFLKKLIPHSGVQKVMSEIKVNPWLKKYQPQRSCRFLFLRAS